MRLRRVVLSGFKTFARRTEVELDSGITAVVGPNGSGKSNLVDAIRWALGETNARELRGARMDEVIHAGGQGRPPLGMAQVDIVVDNHEGRLPLEDSEVEISRRVTRNGDSEFRLNRSRVRLRDLERILSSTGLTQSGYAVVAQNDVDGIIEATPAQRRALVEEAAGVRGLRAAREDALQRVLGVEQSLLRLGDLLADAEPRLAELAGQAGAALEQRELVARLAELRGSLAREEWRAARGRLRRARHRLETARSRAEAAAEAEAGFTARLEAERGRLSAARAARAEAAERLEQARLGAERALGDSRRHEDRATSWGLRRAAAAADEATALAEIERQRALVEELSGAGSDAASLIEDLAAQTQRLRSAHDEAQRRLTEAELVATAAHGALLAAERAQGEAAAGEREQRTRAGLLRETAAGLEAAATGATARSAELRRAADEATGRATAGADRATLAAAEETAARFAHDAAREAVAALDAERATITARVREVDGRAAALRGQVEGALGGGAVAAAVAAGTLEAARLVDRFRVRDERDAAAVEAALELHLGGWLVADLDAAMRLLESGAGREELLEAGLVAPAAGAAAPEGVRRAFDAVEAHATARGALAHCLAGVWLAPDVAVARRAVQAAGGRAVLPDGTVVTPAGVRGGGRPGETIALAAAERDAGAALAALLAAAAGCDEHLAAATERAAAAWRAAAQAGAVAAEAAASAAAAATTAASAAAAVAAEEQRGAALDDELAARRTAIAAAVAAAATAAGAVAAAAVVVAGARDAEAAAVARRDEAGAGLAGTAAALRDHELLVARAEPEARDVQRRLAAARTAAGEAEQRVRAAELHRCAAEEAAVAALARAEHRHAGAAGADAAVAEAEAACAAAAGPVTAREAAVAALDAERSEVAVAVARASDELDAARTDAEGLEARVTELAEALRGDELDEGPEPDAAAAERAEREIVRLERRVAALGPVNGLAPEQHAALEVRVGRLRGDHDDLAGACADLRALAEHLSTEIETRFDAVFGAVAYHFRLLFEELFPGGRATLRLQERVADPAASEELEGEVAAPRRPEAPPGVEILAQPAGKRLQALSLLSGGERALTALAVILALQHVNPSPFYVFDEVDAPLDDANIGRFTRLLRRLAEQQQFLVVTHNHATMAAADALYGVTMGNDGVSRLISVRFVKGQPVPYRGQPAEAAAAS